MGGTNPLTNGDMEIQEDKPALKIESISGCKIISKDDFDESMDVMNSLEYVEPPFWPWNPRPWSVQNFH